MYSKDEQRFLDLASKFKDELEHIDKQIDELKLRRNHVLNVLYGEPIEEISEEAPVEEAPVEEAPVEVVGLGTVSSAQLDKDLVKFVKSHPGCRREDINDFFTDWNIDLNDIKRALARNKRRGLILNTGRGRGSVWHVSK